MYFWKIKWQDAKVRISCILLLLYLIFSVGQTIRTGKEIEARYQADLASGYQNISSWQNNFRHIQAMHYFELPEDQARLGNYINGLDFCRMSMEELLGQPLNSRQENNQMTAEEVMILYRWLRCDYYSSEEYELSRPKDLYPEISDWIEEICRRKEVSFDPNYAFTHQVKSSMVDPSNTSQYTIDRGLIPSLFTNLSSSSPHLPYQTNHYHFFLTHRFYDMNFMLLILIVCVSFLGFQIMDERKNGSLKLQYAIPRSKFCFGLGLWGKSWFCVLGLILLTLILGILPLGMLYGWGGADYKITIFQYNLGHFSPNLGTRDYQNMGNFSPANLVKGVNIMNGISKNDQVKIQFSFIPLWQVYLCCFAVLSLFTAVILMLILNISLLSKKTSVTMACLAAFLIWAIASIEGKIPVAHKGIPWSPFALADPLYLLQGIPEHTLLAAVSIGFLWFIGLLGLMAVLMNRQEA